MFVPYIYISKYILEDIFIPDHRSNTNVILIVITQIFVPGGTNPQPSEL